jgi:predicted transposase YdaD
MANPHDSFFHFIFGPPERAAELLRTALAATLAAAIDWTTLARHDTRLDDGRGEGIEADLVFTAGIAGKPTFLCVLVEHKSSDDPMTAFQLLRYVVRIWERQRQEQPAASRLPPVLPFVLYHGEAPWQSSHSLRGIVDLEGLPRDVALALLAVQPELRFVLDDLAQQSEADMVRRTSSVSARRSRNQRETRSQRHGRLRRES